MINLRGLLTKKTPNLRRLFASYFSKTTQPYDGNNQDRAQRNTSKNSSNHNSAKREKLNENLTQFTSTEEAKEYLAFIKQDALDEESHKALLELSKFSHRTPEVKSVAAEHYQDILSIESDLTLIFDRLFRSSDLNSTVYSIVMDIIHTLNTKGYRTVDSEIKSLLFFSKNKSFVVQTIFDASNLRLANHYLESIVKIRNSRKKKDEFMDQVLAECRTSLVEGFIMADKEYGIETFWKEIFKPMRFIIESRKIGGEVEGETEFITKTIRFMYQKTRRMESILFLMIYAAKSECIPEDELKRMDENFSQSSVGINLNDMLEREIIFVLLNIPFIEKHFPSAYIEVMKAIRGRFSNRFELIKEFLQVVDLNFSRSYLVFLNEEIRIMMSSDSGKETRKGDASYLEFISLLLKALTRIQGFNDFAVRDYFCKKFIDGLKPITDLHPLLVPISDFMGTLIDERLSDNADMKYLADKLYDWLNDSRDRFINLKTAMILYSNILRSEMNSFHPVIPVLARIILSSKERLISGNYELQSGNLNTIIRACHLYYFKSITDFDEINETLGSDLTELVSLCHGLFALMSSKKNKVSVSCIHSYSYFTDFLVQFGYYDNQPEKKKLMAGKVEKLAGILKNYSIQSVKVSTTKYVAQQNNSEGVVKELLKKKNLAFEEQKRLGIFEVDFYLPESGTVIEIDGLVHFTRSSRLPLTKYKMKMAYFRKLGYKTINLQSFLKTSSEEIHESIEKLLDSHLNPEESSKGNT